MRIIKFRLWDYDNESFSKIDFSDLEKTIEELDSFRSYFSASYFVGENYLQEFTGLQDINGKEIYEGDILKTPSNNFCYVVFEDTGFAVKSYGSEAIDWEFSTFYKECEVIGNIHQNPEILN